MWITTKCGTFLKRWDHLTCFLRNLYAGQEATVRTGCGTTDCFQIRKGVSQGYMLSPTYLTYMWSTSCEMMGWMKHKLESRLLGYIAHYSVQFSLVAQSYLTLCDPVNRSMPRLPVHHQLPEFTQTHIFTFPFHFHALEKEMAIHSSIPAWRIPGTGEPGGLPSMGSHRVGHERSDLAAAAAAAAPTLHN